MFEHGNLLNENLDQEKCFQHGVGVRWKFEKMWLKIKNIWASEFSGSYKKSVYILISSHRLYWVILESPLIFSLRSVEILQIEGRIYHIRHPAVVFVNDSKFFVRDISYLRKTHSIGIRIITIMDDQDFRHLILMPFFSLSYPIVA